MVKFLCNGQFGTQKVTISQLLALCSILILYLFFILLSRAKYGLLLAL